MQKTQLKNRISFFKMKHFLSHARTTVARNVHCLLANKLQDAHASQKCNVIGNTCIISIL